MIRARAGHRGITLVEFLGASMIATIVGGSMLLLVNGMRATSQAHTTFRQLSGYLDISTSMLRNDIWSTTSAFGKAGDGSCVAGDATYWLKLDKTIDPAGTWPIVYCFDRSLAPNIQLRRKLDDGKSWVVAQNIAEANTIADKTGFPEIKLQFEVSRAVNGRTYKRQLANLSYYAQVP